MSSKEYMTELSISIDCSAVSQLPAIEKSEDLSAETLLLVSQPACNLTEETDTGFISRYAKLEDVVNYAKKELDIDTISAAIDRKFDRSDVQPAQVISCENIGNPYIISSLHYNGITFVSVEGYPLKDAVNDVISTTVISFDERLKVLESIIAELSVKNFIT